MLGTGPGCRAILLGITIYMHAGAKWRLEIYNRKDILPDLIFSQDYSIYGKSWRHLPECSVISRKRGETFAFWS